MKNFTATLTVVLLALFLPWLAYSQGAKAPVYKAGDSWVFRFTTPNDSGQGKIIFKNGKLVADDADIWSSSWGVPCLISTLLLSRWTSRSHQAKSGAINMSGPVALRGAPVRVVFK